MRLSTMKRQILLINCRGHIIMIAYKSWITENFVMLEEVPNLIREFKTNNHLQNLTKLLFQGPIQYTMSN